MTLPSDDSLGQLLETSERERSALQQTLNDVLSFQRLAETVGETSDLETLVDGLVSTLGRVVPWSAAIVKIGAETSPSHEVYARGMGPRARERFCELEEETLVRWVMESKRPTLIPPMDGPDGVGWILVPLVVQQRSVGLVGLIAALPVDQVTSHQMDMLRLIAAQAAAAMDNLGHMEDVRRNWGELHSLYEVAATLTKSLEVDRLFETVCLAIQDRYQPKVVALGFVAPGSGATRVFSTHSTDEVRALLDIGTQSDGPVVIGQDLSHGSELERLGAKSVLVLPLVANELHLGNLLVGHEQVEFSTNPGVREWFDAVARLLGAALENARLYEELMDSSRKMSELQSRMIQTGRLTGIGQLAGGIAHEINNPLQVILGRIQILQVRCNGMETVQIDLSRLETETMRIAQIVRGMQEFAHQEGVDVVRVPASLATMVESVFELVGFRLKRHRIEVQRVGFQTSPIVLCDQDEIKHLVLNLCMNAIQAMPHGGTLSVSLAERDNKAVLEMGDTGPGISAEDIDRIFDPFFTRQPAAMGMGLAIGFSIAQRHGGSIHAVPGIANGALLRVVLPLHRLRS